MTPLVQAVKRCEDYVVNIHTEKDGVDEGESRFFTPRSRRVTGMGTGIVVDERGYIVTNYHVIHDVDQITVTLKNGELLEARPVSFDRRKDMAIIQVNPQSPLQVMDMGVSSEVMLAEQVFAVGNAFGYEHTVTAGIVSALGRDVEVDETQSYENLIQTDASINPGNSGGPLLNVLGEVIGINVAIRAGAQRIGFAIPIDDARRTVARLLSTERLDGIAHGVFATDEQEGELKKLVVEDIAPGSAAALAGLRKGDTISSVRGVRIEDNADLERSLLGMPVGKRLPVEVIRDGESMDLTFTVGVGNGATVASRTAQSNTVKTVSRADTQPQLSSIRRKALDLLGVQLRELTSQERRSIGNRYRGGLTIVEVTSGSPAAVHGIQKGDVLLGLDGFETLNDRNLTFILQDGRLRKLKSLSFQIFRRNEGALVGQLELKK
ncbi:MAG: trypsin-like peptidase domain-containing protein [Fuerstiella sp.]